MQIKSDKDLLEAINRRLIVVAKNVGENRGTFALVNPDVEFDIDYIVPPIIESYDPASGKAHGARRCAERL